MGQRIRLYGLAGRMQTGLGSRQKPTSAARCCNHRLRLRCSWQKRCAVRRAARCTRRAIARPEASPSRLLRRRAPSVVLCLCDSCRARNKFDDRPDAGCELLPPKTASWRHALVYCTPQLARISGHLAFLAVAPHLRKNQAHSLRPRPSLRTASVMCRPL